MLVFGSDRSPRRGNLGSLSVCPSVYFIDSSFVEAFKQVGRVGEGCGKGVGKGVGKDKGRGRAQARELM